MGSNFSEAGGQNIFSRPDQESLNSSLTAQHPRPTSAGEAGAPVGAVASCLPKVLWSVSLSSRQDLDIVAVTVLWGRKQKTSREAQRPGVTPTNLTPGTGHPRLMHQSNIFKGWGAPGSSPGKMGAALFVRLGIRGSSPRRPHSPAESLWVPQTESI